MRAVTIYRNRQINEPPYRRPISPCGVPIRRYFSHSPGPGPAHRRWAPRRAARPAAPWRGARGRTRGWNPAVVTPPSGPNEIETEGREEEKGPSDRYKPAGTAARADQLVDDLCRAAPQQPAGPKEFRFRGFAHDVPTQDAGGCVPRQSLHRLRQSPCPSPQSAELVTVGFACETTELPLPGPLATA